MEVVPFISNNPVTRTKLTGTPEKISEPRARSMPMSRSLPGPPKRASRLTQERAVRAKAAAHRTCLPMKNSKLAAVVDNSDRFEGGTKNPTRLLVPGSLQFNYKQGMPAELEN